MIKLYNVASKSRCNLKCCLRYNFNDSKYSTKVDSEIVFYGDVTTETISRLWMDIQSCAFSLI
jgi:hypothetical protein